MSFQSFSFLAFLACTVLVCLALARRSRPAAVAALELACVVFYVAGDGWRSLAVLAAGALVTRAALVRLADAAAPHRPPDTGAGLHLAHRGLGGIQIHRLFHRRGGLRGLGAAGTELFHLPAALAFERGL